jgi:hypothetical protein
MNNISSPLPKVTFESDAAAMNSLQGVPPLLNSFAATLVLSRVGYPPDIEELMKDIHYIPGFAFFIGTRSKDSFYRLSACHPFLPPFLPATAPCILHVGLGKYDFLVQFMSDRFLAQGRFYEHYPVIMSFSQASDGMSPPKGGELLDVDGKPYLRLFHHTDSKGKTGITRDALLAPSRWNFCGTRTLSRTHCYLTDLPQAGTIFDTLPLLMRTSPGTQIIYRTDDQQYTVSAGVEMAPRDLHERISFLVAPELIQPNPMVYHLPLDGQPTWLEIEFTRIYRCPCDGLKLQRSVEIDGETHWVLDVESAQDLRADDPITWANGNSKEALLRLIDDCYID